MRSPLVSQLALLDNIERNQIPLTSQLIQQVRAHAQRSMNLAEQFLQVRAEQIQEAQFYECDLITSFITGSMLFLRWQAKKGIQLIFEPDMDDAWTIGNPALLERVIINLLSKCHQVQSGTNAVHVQLTPSPETQADFWQIAIEDEALELTKQNFPRCSELSQAEEIPKWMAYRVWA